MCGCVCIHSYATKEKNNNKQKNENKTKTKNLKTTALIFKAYNDCELTLPPQSIFNVLHMAFPWHLINSTSGSFWQLYKLFMASGGLCVCAHGSQTKKLTSVSDNRTRGLETNYRSLLYYHIWTYYARCGCVFIRETQNLPHNASKQDKNDIFPELMCLYQTEYNSDAIIKNTMLL